MIQCLWSINNFRGYHPELQVSCMGVSKMISHTQQHFMDRNNLLIPPFVTPCPPKSSTQPSQVSNCFLLLMVHPSRLYQPGKLSPWAHSEHLSPSRSVQSYLQIPQSWSCSSAGRMFPAPGV